MIDVALFPLTPRRFLLRIFFKRIGTRLDDVSDARPEMRPDLFEPPLAALILGGIVKEGGDRFVFRAAGIDDEARNGEQVAEVGYFRAFAPLAGVDTRCVTYGVEKAIG